ncbi:MAG: AmmeMemoRadiSam system protein B, partial [Candidatus Bathyarchaeota archaeon]
KIAEAKDHLAIEAMLKLDASQLQSTVESKNISMCGCGPVSSAIIASKKLGATRSQLLSYKTSGDLTGDRDQVVGYVSLAITK